jgi:hypothetical protein
MLGITSRRKAEKAPSKWEKVKQALWETNLNAPVRGWYNLLNADPNIMLGAGSPDQQQAAIEAATDTAGGMMVGGSVVPKPRGALMMGIKAYHGSPHSFDKFSMDKIGTGEGAQAYGHGLYFAENEGVAREYRDALSRHLLTDSKRTDLAQYAFSAARGDVAKAKQILQRDIDQYNAKGWPDVNYRNQYDEAIASLDAGNVETPGRMYEVNIDADPNAFLDWDNRLGDQPAYQKIKNYADEARQLGLEKEYKDFIAASQMRGMDGGDFVKVAVKGKSVSDPNLTRDLRAAGIPGIKYLDAGSRGAGDGTRNYVVFDDKLISIVRKYGIAGASAMLGYNVLQGLDKAQADTLSKADLDREYDSFLKRGGI